MAAVASIIPNPTIEKDSLVLVTGATGYIASHCVDQLLEAGYRVRGTVRSAEKAKGLVSVFDSKYGAGRFSLAIVPDLAADHAFDEAVKGVDAICHTASVMTFSDKPDEVIVPVVKGALEILKAASLEPRVKAVVYTSSSTAALTPKPNVPMTITTETWNDETVEQANSTPNPWNVYGASKTQAERAFWQAISETKPPFQAAAVLPNANFGPVLRPGGERDSSTGSFALKWLEGNPVEIPPQWAVDVRDTARLHVIALVDPEANGKRLFAFAEPYNDNDMFRVLRRLYPGNKNLPEDKSDPGKDLSVIPTQEAEALLQKHYGKGFTGFEESVTDNLKGVVPQA